jgi:hypothetical protein
MADEDATDQKRKTEKQVILNLSTAWLSASLQKRDNRQCQQRVGETEIASKR